jgi:hypothetical protein
MRSTTTTIEAIIHADRLVIGFEAGTAGAVAVSCGGLTGSVGTTPSATCVSTGPAGAAAGVAGFSGRADGRVR